VEKDLELSVVIPCLNEQGTIATCVRKALQAMHSQAIKGEVIVVDNGSTDNSVAEALRAGARVLHQEVRGYGAALTKGFNDARGTYIIMGDADDTYDFSIIGDFLVPLQQGKQFVMGSRFRGKILPGSMPWLHRYIGTPLLTFIINIFFKSSISDVNCGMRGFCKDILAALDLKSNGMELASEMVIKAAAMKLSMGEIPINLFPSPAGRSPHLHALRDGWRHLRFMLIYCPKYLFIYPGLFLLLLGALMMLMFFFKSTFFSIPTGLSTVVLANALLLMGMQIALFGVYSLVLLTSRHILPEDKIGAFLQNNFTLEKGLCIGGIILGCGTIAFIAVMCVFLVSAYNMPHVHVPLTKAAIASIFVALLGVQIIFSSFYISIFNLTKTLD